MKALIAIFAALSLPILLLNLLGGLVSGVWLAILGQWASIGLGVVSFFGSTFLLGFALMPGFLLALPAAKFAEKNNYFGMYFFALLGGIYTFSVISVWCGAVMWFFLHRATDRAVVPLLLWSYGVAIGPLSYMASKETGESGSMITVFFAALSYISAGLWVLFGSPSVLNVLTLIACIMAVGMLAMFANSVAVLREQRGNRVKVVQ